MSKEDLELFLRLTRDVADAITQSRTAASKSGGLSMQYVVFGCRCVLRRFYCQKVFQLIFAFAFLTLCCRINTLLMYALLAMEVLARHFASHNAECYIACMPAVVSAAAGKGGVAASALMCAASFIRALHLQCIPFLGDLMPKLLACIQHDPAKSRRVGSSSSSSGSDDECTLASARASKAEASKGDFTIMEAALTSLAVVATELPQFLSPFLPALVEALLLQHVTCTSSSRTRDVLLGCVEAVARGVQHRLLVPLLSEKWLFAVANGGESVKMLAGLAAATAANLKQDELQLLLPQLLKFALVSLDLRFSVLSNEESTIVDDIQGFGKGGKSASGLEACEDAVVSAIIAIVMKLSERKFQPLFTRLVDWAFGGISFTADGCSAAPEELQRLHAQAIKDPGSRLHSCCRHTAMFRLVFALSSSLKAIFAPFFKLVLNRAVTVLQFPHRIFPDLNLSNPSSSETSVSKGKRNRCNAADGAAAAVHMLPLRRACSVWILRGLESCCRHDVAALINKERFDMCERDETCCFSVVFDSFLPGSAVLCVSKCKTSAGALLSAHLHAVRSIYQPFLLPSVLPTSTWNTFPRSSLLLALPSPLRLEQTPCGVLSTTRSSCTAHTLSHWFAAGLTLLFMLTRDAAPLVRFGALACVDALVNSLREAVCSPFFLTASCFTRVTVVCVRSIWFLLQRPRHSCTKLKKTTMRCFVFAFGVALFAPHYTSLHPPGCGSTRSTNCQKFRGYAWRKLTRLFVVGPRHINLTLVVSG
jgi:hypothetical protein